jgi:probable biosynthetic protein (TIGR04098 family)
MTVETHHIAGLPQLDIHTLSEDWALAASLQNHWTLLADSVGLQPSRWFDSQGERMYGAVMALTTDFVLDDPLREDDHLVLETEFLSIRKPHAWSRTRVLTGGRAKAEVCLLTSFVKRRERGSNKKFAKVRDLWTAPDHDGEIIDDLLERHHAAKGDEWPDQLAMTYEVNRIQDFNTADFMYFKNYVRIMKAAEWRENRGRPTRLNAKREVWFYGNVSDGEVLSASVARDGDDVASTLRDAEGKLLAASRALAPVVQIAVR